MDRTNYADMVDHEKTSPELRTWVDENYGPDFKIVTIGLLRMVVMNARNYYKLSIPPDLNPTVPAHLLKGGTKT